MKQTFKSLMVLIAYGFTGWSIAHAMYNNHIGNEIGAISDSVNAVLLILVFRLFQPSKK